MTTPPTPPTALPEPSPARADASPEAVPAARRARAWLADLTGVLVHGLRLWVAHWPVLLVVALLGGAGRAAALWLAVEVSEHSTVGAWALLALAPLSAVAAVIAMLVVLRPALPGLARIAAAPGPADPAAGRERRLVDVLASVFVPFLAVYATYGYLAEDRFRFVNTVTVDRELLSNAGILDGTDTFDGERYWIGDGWVAAAVVLVALVVRWALGRLEGRLEGRAGRRDARVLGFLGAYVEAFWLLVAAAWIGVRTQAAWAWLESRQAVAIVLERWLDLLDALGPVAGPVDLVVDTLAGTLGALDDLVVLPLAWLTVGAVVYGHRLTPPPPPQVAPAAWQRLPAPVRRWTTDAVAPVVGDVRARLSALVGGLRQLAVAGLAPMLVFALAFLLATRAEEGVRWAMRAATGPLDTATYLAFAPHLEVVAHAVGLTVVVALLAAGVDRVLHAQGAQPSGSTA
ncbi:hypothetical protein [Cellulomonas oligotrophica]|uniref:Uncharacterized membrane protein YkvA (DUF1232 family) n=1 Tax=Cellulomonas oligotrophica TaxID=931536 RepID=A0A7Y9FHY1_9CELL|nr:hypothetical protein [Cellulomonas oligotrophica]NYD87671.1 uncharacterized membrane protein YkvA (DUF1232 family) [Cellulomonas oligotrophica]GIG33124.1 hypothetical protein Col01nite_22830 [Cellulomonas oligotrophica]